MSIRKSKAASDNNTDCAVTRVSPASSLSKPVERDRENGAEGNEPDKELQENEALMQQEALNKLAAAIAAQQAAQLKHEQRQVLMRHVCEKSGLIGPAYLAKPNTIRRVTWTSLITMFVCFTSYQINKQVQLWRANPISTVWSQVYPDSMHFPSIAFCNTNNARASFNLKHGYRVQQRWRKLRALNKTQLSMYEYTIEHQKLSTTTYRTLRDESAHHITDMLLRCTWPNGTRCRPSDFKMMRTDVGICFAINHNRNDLINLTTAGTSESLHLALNIEKYDSMFRADSDCESTGLESSGIYVHIFQPGKKWLVSSESMVIEAGTQATIELHTVQRQIVPTGRHACMQDRPSPNFVRSSSSSRGACVIDQWIADIQQHCGCMPYNAPTTTTDTTAQCTIYKTMTCAQGWLKISRRVLDKCPIPCHYEEYTPAMSVAKLPINIIKYKSVQGVARKRVKRRKRQVDTISPETKEFNDVMFMDLSNHTLESLMAKYAKTNYNTTNQEHPGDCSTDSHVLKHGTPQYVNFAYRRFQGREAQHRVLQEFSGPLKSLVNAYNQAVSRVRNESWLPMEGHYRPLIDRLHVNVPCFHNLSSNISYAQIIQQIEMQSDPDYEIPDLLIDRVIRELYANNSEERETAKYAIKAVQQVLTDLWGAFATETWNDKFSFSSHDDQQVLPDMKVWSEMYLNETMSRYTWATLMLSDRVTVFWNYFFAQVFVQTLVDQLDDYHMTYLEQFNESEVLNASVVFDSDPGLQQLAALLTLNNSAPEMGVVLQSFVRQARECRGSVSLSNTIDHIGDHLMYISNKLTTAHQALLLRQRTFMDEHNDRAALEKNNIVTVTIYMKDVSFQVMEQEPTYTGWSLMCDIGGSLGLFMGASIIGLVELIWLVFLEPCMSDDGDDQSTQQTHKSASKPVSARSEPCVMDNNQDAADHAQADTMPMTALPMSVPPSHSPTNDTHNHKDMQMAADFTDGSVSNQESLANTLV